MSESPAWTIVLLVLSTVLSGASGLGVALILYTLKQITRRQDKSEVRQEAIEKELADVKVAQQARMTEVEMTKVSREDWVRSEGYTRQELQKLNSTLARMAAQVAVVERLPEIAGEIAKQVAAGMRGQS